MEYNQFWKALKISITITQKLDQFFEVMLNMISIKLRKSLNTIFRHGLSIFTFLFTSTFPNDFENISKLFQTKKRAHTASVTQYFVETMKNGTCGQIFPVICQGNFKD